VDALMEVTRATLNDGAARVDRNLDALAGRLVEDNRFRLAAVNGLAAERSYLVDYAGTAMGLLGLDMLQIQDEEGRILSSGHFRNLFDHVEPSLPWYLERNGRGLALAEILGPRESFLALVRARPFTVGVRRFTLVGGVKVDARFLRAAVPDDELTLTLSRFRGESPADTAAGQVAALPSDRVASTADIASPGDLSRSWTVPLIRPEDVPGRQLDTATLTVSHSLEPLRRLRRGLDLWLGAILLVSAAGSLFLAFWLSDRLSRPLAELAEKTAAIDLDRPETRFAEDRRDEVGTLARVLNAMTERLRAGAVQLRDAERRATRGEMARQVNHDIRNGLTPIRNVFRHLGQVAREEPDRLPEIFTEREGALDAGMDYLESLAASYARLSARAEPRPCDVNAVAAQVVSGAAAGTRKGVTVRVTTTAGLPPVMADPVSLRRIIENLVRNAVECLEGPGRVEVATARETGDDGTCRVVVTVTDTGPGISAEARERIFDDFYTTKREGAGLGLSIVRRLVADLEGSIRVESEPGKGSRFILRLPALGPGGNA
jgi:signal transduction histidine kinase